jgi:hypothetical protein
MRYGRDIVAPPGNQAATEKTNFDLSCRVPPLLAQGSRCA